MSTIDAHHHLWDPTVRDYPFLAGDDLTPIRRRYRLADLRHLAAQLGIDRTVLVQTVSDEAETREFLSVAASSGGLIAGVIGWVDLTADDVTDRLHRLREGPGGELLVGVRHQIEDEPDPRWAVRDDVLHGIRAVGAAGLTFDLLVREPQWPAALELAGACPDVPMVLDHAGKPSIAGGELGAWAEWIRALATHQNLLVKISGLVTEADWHHWRPEDLQPVVNTVLEAFGASRAMVGSDWPVAELAGSVHRSWQVLTELVRQRAGDDPMGANAERFYSLSPTAAD